MKLHEKIIPLEDMHSLYDVMLSADTYCSFDDVNLAHVMGHLMFESRVWRHDSSACLNTANSYETST